MSRLSTITLILGTALVVASGYVHGMWTGRWHSTAAIQHAADAVRALPETIGDWKLHSEKSLTQEELDLAQVAGYVSRSYRNQQTGEMVDFIMMCGKPGPIAVHPPTACYTGLGYRQLGETKPLVCEIDTDNSAAQKHVFRSAVFESPDRSHTTQPHVAWAWSTNGTWQTPDTPRMAFVGNPVLYKMYVAYDSEAGTHQSGPTPADHFLQAVIPIVKQAVWK